MNRNRPHPPEETPTSYQNAMVGSVSLHRSPVNDEKGPQRLSSRYIAQMPEDGFTEYRRYLKVVDSFHATQYLANAAEAAYGSATYDSQGWFRKWKERLLTVDRARSCRKGVTGHGIPAEKQQAEGGTKEGPSRGEEIFPE